MTDVSAAPIIPGPVPLLVVADSIPVHTAIIAPLRAAWGWILATVVVFVVLVLYQQATVTPVYSATAVVAAATPPSASKLGSLRSLASIADVDIGGKQLTPFDQFLFVVYSPDLARYQIKVRPMLRLVFADDWDAARRQWRRPAGVGAALRAAFYPIFQLPGWSAPDSLTLADHYGRVLDERKLADGGLMRLAYADTNPQRAAAILALMISDGNEKLRLEAAAAARAQAQYLRARIVQTEVREYRNALLDLLAQQEQTLLLSNGATPYAAKVIETVTVSTVPTSQRPVIYALIAAVFGFSVSAFVAIVVYNRGAFRARRSAEANVNPVPFAL